MIAAEQQKQSSSRVCLTASFHRSLKKEAVDKRRDGKIARKASLKVLIPPTIREGGLTGTVRNTHGLAKNGLGNNSDRDILH
eukprot:gene27330-14170_t